VVFWGVVNDNLVVHRAGLRINQILSSLIRRSIQRVQGGYTRSDFLADGAFGLWWFGFGREYVARSWLKVAFKVNLCAILTGRSKTCFPRGCLGVFIYAAVGVVPPRSEFGAVFRGLSEVIPPVAGGVKSVYLRRLEINVRHGVYF
jgi:hypothetical protein